MADTTVQKDETVDTGDDEIKEDLESGESEDKGAADYKPEVRQGFKSRAERAKFFSEKKKGEGKVDEGEEDDDKPLTRGELKKLFQPLTESFDSRALSIDIKAYLASEPEMRKYEAKALKYLQVHPTVPVSDAFELLASRDLNQAAKESEEEKDKAKAEAKKREVRGSPSRPDKAPSKLEAFSKELEDPEKVAALNRRVRAGERINLAE